MPPILMDIFSLVGFLLRILGFLVAGWALARLVFERFRAGSWQLEAAYLLGLILLFIAVMAFTSAGSAGAFALGIGAAYFMAFVQRKTEPVEVEPPRVE